MDVLTGAATRRPLALPCGATEHPVRVDRKFILSIEGDKVIAWVFPSELRLAKLPTALIDDWQSEPKAQIVALIEFYIDRFNADDFALAFKCYRMPFTWLFGRQALTVTSRTEFLTMMTSIKAGLVARGLRRSRVLGIAVQMLDKHVAFAEVTVMRTLADGSDLEKIGGTYLVHNDGADWRFASHAMHAVDAICPAREL